MEPVAAAAAVEFKISPDVILFVFLPTLIFESSLHLDARELRADVVDYGIAAGQP